MPKRIIPVLSADKGFLSEASDKAAYLLTYFIYNPSGVSDYFEDEQISLRTIAYEYQHNPEDMANKAQAVLSSAFKRAFPDLNITVDVTTKNIDGYKYGLRFEVLSAPKDTQGSKPIVMSGSFAIDENYRIKLEYTR